nr:hypothetical protein [uncultured Prevotella sp.]
MLGISIFAVILTYVTFGIFHALDKAGKHISSYSDKSMEDAPKFIVEKMYSSNNKLSLFFKTDNSYSILVSNHIINKEEFVFADNPTNLRNKVARVLRNYAAIEKEKNRDIVIL